MNAVFITVCGAADEKGCRREYNFLMGSIEYHASMGRHIVLDNCPEEHHLVFSRLPSSVTWIYEPIYGHGKEVFRAASALLRLDSLARSMFSPDVIVYTDCDEYWSRDSVSGLWPEAARFLVETPTIHVDIHGQHWSFVREWHRRAWPGKISGIDFPIRRGGSNPNPERHPIAVTKDGLKLKRVAGCFHQHMRCFIGGGGYYADGTVVVNPPPWPEPLRLWKENGEEPLEKFR